MRRLFLALLAITCSLATKAAAQADFGYTNGIYIATFDADRPTTGTFIVEVDFNYDVFNVATGQHLYGNDYPFATTIADFTEPTTTGSILFKSRGPYITDFFDGADLLRKYGSYRTVMYFLNFGPASRVHFSLERVGDFVPEPSAWALMILGIGATGLKLRARRRKPAPRLA